MIIVYHQMDPTQTDGMSTVITRRLLYFRFLLIILTKSTHLVAQLARGTYSWLQHRLMWVRLEQYISCIQQCYDLFPFLLIYFLFCLSLCAAPCLTLFTFLCACLIAYLCVVLGHILHDTQMLTDLCLCRVILLIFSYSFLLSPLVDAVPLSLTDDR